MSDSEDSKSDIESIIEEKSTQNEDIEELTSSIQSGKKSKPRTEKQLAALEKARATRKANTLKKKQMEIDNQILEEENKKYLKKIVDNAKVPEKEHYVPKNKAKKKTKIIYADDSEPSDEEVIIVKKRPKKKKATRKKRIVYESESSESESEEEQHFDMDDLTQPQKNKVHYQEEPQYQYVSNKPLKYSDLINYG